MADQYSVFNPTVDLNPYATQIAEIQRRQRMAQLLQQQGMDPLESQVVGGRVIPISPWQVLAKGLQAGLGAYQGRKAEQAAAELQDRMAEEQRTREAEVESAGKAIAGRMFGERDQYTKEGMPIAAGPTVREAPTSGDQLGEITPTARYQYDPQSAFQTAMTPAGREAMKGNPMLAAALANMVKPKTLELGAIDPSKFTPESIREAQISGDIGKLKAISAPTKTDLQFKTREYVDAKGNKMTQAFNFDPTTGKSVDVGAPYKSGMAPTPTPTESAEGLRKEYSGQTSQYRSIADAWQKIKNAASNPSAANDISMIYGYMRINDPTSTVREGEFATAQNAAGVPTQVLNMYNRVLNGERLSEDQRQDFVRSAYNLVESQMPNAQALSDRYSDIARRSNINPENVVSDPFASSRVVRVQGENDPAYAKLKAGDFYFGPDGMMRRKK